MYTKNYGHWHKQKLAEAHRTDTKQNNIKSKMLWIFLKKKLCFFFIYIFSSPKETN